MVVVAAVVAGGARLLVQAHRYSAALRKVVGGARREIRQLARGRVRKRVRVRVRGQAKEEGGFTENI